MGELADKGSAEFVLALGDTFHYMGIESTSDPLWKSNFEEVYNHPELQIPWYPVIGNHESQGNIKALIDYSNISRRWQMPSRYYTKLFTTDEGEQVEIFVIDTCPIIDKYQREEKYIGTYG